MFVLIASAIAACCAAAIMTYVSLATPLGPWIEPVLVLAVLAVLHLVGARGYQRAHELLACIAVSGGVAGIIAVSCAFSYPTLFFLEPLVFADWLRQPWYFVGTLTTLIVTTGSIAFGLVWLWEESFMSRSDLPFPVVELINKLMQVRDSIHQEIQFFKGILAVLGAVTLEKCLRFIAHFSLHGAVRVPLAIKTDVSALLIALGFVMGHTLAIPLVIGLLTKITLLAALKKYFFLALKNEHILFSWCSGMVVYGTVEAFCHLMRSLKNKQSSDLPDMRFFSLMRKQEGFAWPILLFLVGSFVSSALFFRLFGFSWIALIYLWIGTVVCTYQLLLIAGRIGLAPLGRFALLVTVPGLMLFQLTSIQITFVATFVELCAGIAVDLMFGRKLAYYAQKGKQRIVQSQLIGLIMGGITVSVVLWYLSTSIGLANPPLIAQRACTRALLVKAHHFDLAIVLLGAAFSFLLTRAKVNTVLVMSGLMMPLHYTIPLVLGSVGNFFIKHREKYYPFWAGVFTSASLVTLISLLLTY